MKTNENEPKKETHERERELNEFEAKRQNTLKLVQKGVNHERHGRHEKRSITERRPMKRTQKGNARKRKGIERIRSETPEYTQARPEMC